MPALRTRDTLPQSALEVSTDAPMLQPPTLEIISPTPRAFTFPINQADHSASPYVSPSSSPFEQDLKPSTPSLRTLSPVSSIQSASYSPSTSLSPSTAHKRRKSSCGDVDQYRPKKGDEDYVKRPENAFILFRRHCCEERQAAAELADTPAKKQRQADLSKTISEQWKSLAPEERQVWESRAKEKKKEHEQLYPNYVYRPQRASKSKKAKGKFEEDGDNNISFMLPLAAPSVRHGRSVSAPTPPLGFQSIQLPNVYMPSCPTSPSVMMSRRASHPGHSEERSTHFDFLPQDTMAHQPQFAQPGAYESNMAPPQFYTGMFEQQQPFADKHNMLQPLTMPEPILLAPHEIISPASSIASGYSSPASPQFGPYTPVRQHTLDHQYSHEYHHSQPICGSPEDSTGNIEYSTYGWEQSQMWSNGSEILLGDDFDLNAIPPIELGTGKFQDQLNLDPSSIQGYSHESYPSYHDEHYHHNNGIQGSFDGMFYNDMMSSGHGF